MLRVTNGVAVADERPVDVFVSAGVLVMVELTLRVLLPKDDRLTLELPLLVFETDELPDTLGVVVVDAV
jgi:hypothetical protein